MITNADQLIAGLIRYPFDFAKDASTAEAVGIKHSLWYATGVPAAGSAPTGALNGAVFTGTAGVPPTGGLGGPVPSTGEEIDLYGLDVACSANVAVVEIYDRLWGNVPVVTTTTSQGITSPVWPARDGAGGTSGTQVRLFLEASATTGNAGAITNTTCSYTNSAGTSGRTGTIASYPATALQGTWVPFTLAGGDDGVRSVQSITLGTSYVSGQVNMIAARLIARIGIPASVTSYSKDFTTIGLPAVWDNAVLGLVVMPTGTAVGTVAGALTYAQG